MKKLIHILLFLISSILGAQNLTQEERHQIDSLNIIINNNSNDTSLAGAFVGLSEILYVSNQDTMLPLCNKSLSIIKKALKNNVSEKERFSLLKSKALALNNIGYIYDNKGDIPKALEYFHESLKIKEEINDKQGIATSYNNIGMLYSKQGDSKTAINYFNSSLKIRMEINDSYGIANSFNNLGLIHYNLNNLDSSILYFKKSLEIRIEIEDFKGISNSYVNIGSVYRTKGDLSEALKYYYQGLEIQKKYEDKKGIVNSLTSIGNIELQQGNISIAKTNGEKALKLAQEIGFVDQIKRAARLIFKVAQRKGDWKKAFEMRELEILMRDSINNENAIKALAKQQAKYEYEKAQAIKDKEHEKQLAVEKEAKIRQKLITYTVGVGLVMVVLFLFIVFNRLQLTKKQKIIIEDKNKEILDSISYAKRIQTAILPSNQVLKNSLKEAFVLYKPKDIVAGDFYWLEHKEDKVMFAACDCTGHGVPGAMVSVVCNNGLNRSVREYNLTDPGKILDKTREIVIQEFEKSEEEVKDGMDIALCSLQGNTLHYAGANNPLWIIRKGAEEIEEIKADKQPIGKYAEPTPYKTHTIELQKGDTIYIFSDGYVDQFGGEKGKKFKAANFKKILLSIQNESMEQQRDIINKAFEDWKGDLEQLDDVCVIGVRI